MIWGLPKHIQSIYQNTSYGNFLVFILSICYLVREFQHIGIYMVSISVHIRESQREITTFSLLCIFSAGYRYFNKIVQENGLLFNLVIFQIKFWDIFIILFYRLPIKIIFQFPNWMATNLEGSNYMAWFIYQFKG